MESYLETMEGQCQDIHFLLAIKACPNTRGPIPLDHSRPYGHEIRVKISRFSVLDETTTAAANPLPFIVYVATVGKGESSGFLILWSFLLQSNVEVCLLSRRQQLSTGCCEKWAKKVTPLTYPLVPPLSLSELQTMAAFFQHSSQTPWLRRVSPEGFAIETVNNAENNWDAHTTSTPAERSSSIILPWDNISAIILEDDALPLTPCNTSFSPLPSPVPLPTKAPSFSTLPSPLYPPHWVTCIDERPSAEYDIIGMDSPDVVITCSDCQDGTRRKRSRRRSIRGDLDDVEGMGENFMPLDPQKYKTELCRSFQVYSYCRCNYAHGLQDLRDASRHGKYKTRNCQSYHQTGFCRYGARCLFIHDPEEGVLKCSIANKEVLEALHYRPSDEECPRTANITWRFLESLGEPASELHFISSTIASQESDESCLVPTTNISEGKLTPSSPFRSHVNLCIRSDDNKLDETGVVTYAIPRVNHSNVNSTRLLQENLNLLLSLQVGDESSKRDALPVSDVIVNSSLSVPDTVGSEQAPILDRFNGALGHKQNLCDGAYMFPWSVSPVKSPKSQELSDEEKEKEVISVFKPSTAVLQTYRSSCRELKDMEIIHTILNSAPVYSASVWSDGMDTKQSSESTSQAATMPNNEKTVNDKDDKVQSQKECRNHYEQIDTDGSKRRNKNVSRRKKKTRQRKSSSNDSESHPLSKTELHQSLKDDVFSSTFLSDSTSDDDYTVLTAAAGPDGDEWSKKSSLHLADLLCSLRLREGNNQLMPRCKTGRMYSSDGSSVGHSSPKEPRSSPSSHASPRQHDATKYKTTLCRSFQYNGYCGYGDACLYAHGPMDLRAYPKHPMYRTKQCFSFHNKGFCLYGSRCQFLHDLE
ncbi:hypothetical protein SK128_010680 [Halocaridina rubra]|uniref:C3H1-type domain-containing protein n=1 Tax=Halocaridina rubra TaxID=373956 RepID=A0AAN8X1X1_HALRR